MRNRLLEQAKKEYPAGQRLLAIAIEGIFFLGIFPAAITLIGRWLDQFFRIERPVVRWPLHAFGAFLIISGLSFALWAVVVQFKLGRGTPVPVMATQNLIVRPPYQYTRNPMALGTIVMYLGLAVLLVSVSAAGIVLTLSIALLIYIRRIEEREMLQRFGDEYIAYKDRTPFLIPRF